MTDINHILTKAQQQIKELTGRTFYFVPASSEPKGQYTPERTMNAKQLMDTALSVVCKYYGIHTSLILQPDNIKGSRKQEYVECREILMKLIRENILPTPSNKSIGEFLGNRDHSTVINGIQKINNLIETEPGMKKNYRIIEQKFREYFTPKECAKVVEKLNGHAVKLLV